MNVLQDKLIDSQNEGKGRLCTDKQLIVVEFKDPDTDGFTYKFSSKEADYMKCQRFTFCGKVGIHEKVYCYCNKVYYCSTEC